MLTNADTELQDPAPSLESTHQSGARSRLSRRASAIDQRLPQTHTVAQRMYAPLRRIVELAGALGLLVVTSPVLLVAVLLVKLTSSGPAFYTQARVGRGGRVFTIFKLRTMIHNCESLTGPRWCIPDDPRITWFGWILRRTHIDELPQLLNVLRGDMSLIGPRPERPEFVAELTEAIPGYMQRHSIRPGITGLAQVHLPPDTDTDSVRRKLVYDLYYIRRIGPWLDVRLIACTLLNALAIPSRIAGRICFIPSKPSIEANAPMAAQSGAQPARTRPGRVAA